MELHSYKVGAVPLLNALLERMRLAEILAEHLPPDDPRTELPTVCALVLLRNVLIAREPIYGVAEWAACFPPDLLDRTMRWRCYTMIGWDGAWIGCSPVPGRR